MFNIDINESELYNKYPQVLEILLFDNTTRKNIIWATDSYKRRGYKFNDFINSLTITSKSIIVPRSVKLKAEQVKRSKYNAEVFTPSWMCNKQNNLIDESWFGRKNVFNKEYGNSWEINNDKILFNDDKNWIDYVRDIRLEVTCGEAPYLVSRYDTVNGDYIDINNRIGLLDRKFRVINENAISKEEWLKYSLEALKATYGYEWQGDNLLLARENVFLTYIDYYKNIYNEEPCEDLLIEVATIISWNLWQMDGIKYVIPKSCKVDRAIMFNLFGEEEIREEGCIGCTKGDLHSHNGVYSKIMDWNKNKKIRFVDLIYGGYIL